MAGELTMRVEKIGLATLYLGDCREIAPTLEPVPTLMMDPPYSSGGYQEAGRSSGSIGTDAAYKWGADGPSIAGDTLSTRGYHRLIRDVAKSVRAVEAFVFCDWRMWTTTCDALEDGFFRVRSMIVWNKKTPGMGVGWRGQHELICYGRRRAARPGSGQGNVLTISRSGNVYHPTEKPEQVIAALLDGAEAGAVCDPFMGAGTTGVVATAVGRPFIGIEIEPRYFEIACRRIEQAQRQGDMFRDSAA
jgi:DNA modification methylase